MAAGVGLGSAFGDGSPAATLRFGRLGFSSSGGFAGSSAIGDGSVTGFGFRFRGSSLGGSSGGGGWERTRLAIPSAAARSTRPTPLPTGRAVLVRRRRVVSS